MRLKAFANSWKKYTLRKAKHFKSKLAGITSTQLQGIQHPFTSLTMYHIS